MQDWSKYIERPYTELQKDDINIQLVCDPEDMDDFEEKERSEEVFSLDDSEWIVEDVFENGESYIEANW